MDGVPRPSIVTLDNVQARNKESMSATPSDPYVLASDDGASIPGAMPGVRMLVKAGTATHAPFTLLQPNLPARWAPPPHIHANEDEAFYVLDGRLTIRCGSKTWPPEPGGMAFLPRGMLHQPSTDGQAAQALVLTSRPGIEHFFAEVGERLQLLPPGPPTIELLDEIGEKYGLKHFPPEAFDTLR